MSIELGKQGRDKISGLTGIIIGRAEYLFGCAQYGIVPRIGANGEPSIATWLDEGRVEVIGDGIVAQDVQVDRPGGPQRDAPRGRG